MPVWSVCVCTSMYRCVAYMYTGMEANGRCWGLCFISLLIHLRQNFLLNLELRWRPASTTNSPISAPHSARVTGVHVDTASSLNQGFKLRSSCLTIKSSYSLSHLQAFAVVNWSRVSLCHSGWPWIHHITQAGLEVILPASASQVLRSLCVSSPWRVLLTLPTDQTLWS